MIVFMILNIITFIVEGMGSILIAIAVLQWRDQKPLVSNCLFDGNLLEIHGKLLILSCFLNHIQKKMRRAVRNLNQG